VSTRWQWKVIVPTAVLAIMVGGAAWATTSNASQEPNGQGIAPALGNGAPGVARPFPAGLRPGSNAAVQRPAGIRGRAEHLTEAKVSFFYEGAAHTLTVEHGVITAVAQDAISLKRLDGQTVTVAVNDQTKVRLDRQWSSLDALKAGDRVFTFQVDGAAAKLLIAFDRGIPAPGATGDLGAASAPGVGAGEGDDQMIAAVLGLAE
jgi:hypothetical protein